MCSCNSDYNCTDAVIIIGLLSQRNSLDMMLYIDLCRQLLIISAQVAGLIYRSKLIKVHSVLRIPSFVSSLFSKAVGPLVTSAAPKDEAPPTGATLELQRQQHIEQLEQQMAWAQLQPRPPGGVRVHLHLGYKCLHCFFC